METKIIKQEMICKGEILVFLFKHNIGNEINYSVQNFSIKDSLVLSNEVFDTLKKAENKFNKEIK